MTESEQLKKLMDVVGNMIDEMEKQEARIKALESAVVSGGELIQNHDEGIKLIISKLLELGIE